MNILYIFCPTSKLDNEHTMHPSTNEGQLYTYVGSYIAFICREAINRFSKKEEGNNNITIIGNNKQQKCAIPDAIPFPYPRKLKQSPLIPLHSVIQT